MTELIRITEGQAITEAEAMPSVNPAAVYVASLGSEAGRRTMRAALENIAKLASGGALGFETFPYHKLTFAHVAAIRAKLAEASAPATVNKALSALRGTLRAAWRLGLMTAEQYQAAADVKGLRGETIPAGRSLTPGELGALMASCANDPTPAGARDAAIIAALYAAGLRRAELVALDLGDYDPQTGEMRITGKGHKERLAWINNGAAQALADWLSVRGGDPGPLFVAINKGHKLSAGRLTPQAVYKMLAKRAEAAGVKAFSPHDLRRTFVSDLLDAGADISTVQKMAGHANVTTTARYDRRPEQAKQKAAALLHVPYHRRGL